VGSSEIAARLDPEEWRKIVAAYHRAAAEAITRFGGHVARASYFMATMSDARRLEGKLGEALGMGGIFAWLAAALERQGAIVDALETVEEALRVNPEELAYRPDIFRVRGEIQLKQAQHELAEADFCVAIALAQKMGAKAWELRATMSLVRLLASQGRRNQARVMLAEIYGWFTEGFDTRDLRDAKALLDELATE
jgi:predicted ATPase